MINLIILLYVYSGVHKTMIDILNLIQILTWYGVKRVNMSLRFIMNRERVSNYSQYGVLCKIRESDKKSYVVYKLFTNK